MTTEEKDLFGAPLVEPQKKRPGRKRSAPYSAMRGTYGACTVKGAKCGNCANLAYNEMRSGKRFYKCGLVKPTNGPGTDVRLKWSACQFWEKIEMDN